MYITLAILVLSAVFFMNGRVRSDLVALCALLGLFVYFCALFCELLAAHTELRFTAVCVALFSGFVYPFLIGALVRLRGMDGILQPQLSLPKLRLRPSARVNGRNAG